MLIISSHMDISYTQENYEWTESIWEQKYNTKVQELFWSNQAMRELYECIKSSPQLLTKSAKNKKGVRELGQHICKSSIPAPFNDKTETLRANDRSC